MIKKFISIILCIALLFTLVACSGKGQEEKAVATVGDIVFTRQQVEMGIATYVQAYGMSIAELRKDKEIWQLMKTDFVNQLVIECLTSEKAAQLGYIYDDAQKALFEEEFASFLQQLDEANRLNAMTDGAIGKEEIASATEKLRERYFAAMGHTAESYKALQERYFITKKVKLMVGDAVEITDDEARSYYETNAVNQEKSDALLTDKSNPLSQSITLYHPNGYRYIKQILLQFPPSVINMAADLYLSGSSDLAPLLERETQLMQARIDEIQAKIDAGVPFDQLVEQYGEDDGMKHEPRKSTGYFIATDNNQLIPSFAEGANKLAKAGDISTCATYKGFYFLYAQEVVDKGAAPYDEVSMQIKEAMKTDKQAYQWDALTKGWLEEATAAGTVTIDLDALD